MKKAFLILIIFLSTQIFAQSGVLFIKGGFDYNFITAGAFKRVGYDKNKYLFSGYSGGIGFSSENVSVDFEYSDLKANAIIYGKNSDIKFGVFDISIMPHSSMRNFIVIGIRANLSFGFGKRIAYGSMRMGPEIDFYPSKYFGFYVSGILNLGILMISTESPDLYNPIPSSNGLASGPEIRMGFKLGMIF